MTDTAITTEAWPGYTIEIKQPFSQSLLWELQQNYFAQQGVDAWRSGQVPHYVSSNPRMANSYAEMAVALWRDQQRVGFSREANDEPIYLIELGVGSGRFAFHFLQRLTQLCQQADIPLEDFCYVLTDVAEQNLVYLSQHPRFQPYFACGLLDLAFFDVNHSTQLHLQNRDRVLTAGGCAKPLVIIANYLFDSIPQELFFINEGQIYQCWVSLLSETDPTRLDEMELLGHVHCKYDYQLLTQLPYAEEPYLHQLLMEYHQTLSDTHLLFPVAGLRCLHRLQELSQTGLLLLTADKGYHQIECLIGQSPPKLVSHTGCFSLNVNYHALKRCCEQSGGIALFPPQQHNHVNVGCLLLLQEAAQYQQTQGAYERHVAEFGLDAFYSITKHARQDIAAMSVRDILAYMQFSLADAHLFACYLPRLIELASEFEPHEWETVRTIVDKVWQNYYPIGEERDLAASMAHLLFEMGDLEGCLTYLDQSLILYGRQANTLLNMALCQQQLDNAAEAEALLREAYELDPGHPIVRQLLVQYDADVTAVAEDFARPSFKPMPLLMPLVDTAVSSPPDLVFRPGAY
jgi:tetratricopeptide (TPR) repeat protein